MIKSILLLVIWLIGTVIYKVCVPVMFLLIVCKLWYKPYSWSWLNTILVPLGCWVCGIILAAIAKTYLE